MSAYDDAVRDLRTIGQRQAHANVIVARRQFLDLVDREDHPRFAEAEIGMLHDYVETLEALLEAHGIEYES